MRLRTLANFPCLVHLVFDEDEQQILSAFTVDDLNDKKNL